MIKRNKKTERKQEIKIGILFFILGLVSRLPLVEKIQSHWDGPQYSLAIVQYSFVQQTPAPPGYPLYIAMGKFFYLFLHDPHRSILMVSVFGSAIGAMILFFIAKRFYGLVVGIFCSLIFLTGSTFYYFGLTPYAYGILPIPIILVAYYTYLSYIKRSSHGILFGASCALLFGIRPQEMMFIAPLALLGFLFLKHKDKIIASIIFIFITIAWFLPLSMAVGGMQSLFETSSEFSKTAIPTFSFWKAFINYEIILKGVLLTFGLSIFLLLYYPYQYIQLRRKKKKVPYKEILFFLVWILPGFIFNLFIRSDHAGYQMSFLTALLLLIGLAFSKITGGWKKIYIVLFLVLIATFNLFWFFYNRDPFYTKPYRPTSFHYSDIRKNDLKVGGKVAYITKTYSPKTTLIITTPVLWRPYMYYLKEYDLIDLTVVTDKKHIRRDVKHWKMKEYIDTSKIIHIPQHIKTIVFVDDQASLWLKNYPKKIISLQGNSFLTEISVTSKNILIYDFQNITVGRK